MYNLKNFDFFNLDNSRYIINYFCSLFRVSRWSCGGINSEVIYWFLVFFDNLLLLIAVLVNIAFITLIERKVLSYSQRRIGPNKPSFIGIFQPIADAIKLFTKNLILPEGRHKIIFGSTPFIALFLVLWVWVLIPKGFEGNYHHYSRIFLLIIIRLNVYPLLLRGWASTNKYSIVGALRRVAQTISYEIRLALVFLAILLSTLTLPLDFFSNNKDFFKILLVVPTMLGVWLISRLAETNRTPFDFAEGERELVSGFNTEYRAAAFAVIFIAEYGRIYFLGFLSSFIFIPSSSFLVVARFTTVLVFFWIWARSTFPRYRYDLLITLAWKRILPLILRITIFIGGVILY